MSKYGFLDVLDQKMEKDFPYDFEINWDKKNHAVEVAFLLEVENQAGIETVDDEGNRTTEDIFFEEAVLFYNPLKSTVQEEEYLATIPYEQKKGLSSEFLAYFVEFLAETAEKGLDDLMDFLADEEAEEFAIVWDKEAFENGRAALQEKDFHPYPRY
ncbi:DUF3013 family protein [Streptococcus sp. zg-86]|uniref:DUF3013 family protein n=1 Tax=Streptococcus zhangguiae TaxID=2664091 RepID=A0A6I4RD83_9STRE|nr:MULTISPECIES: DUF3013 family protein [unclassified Streptococcus]MTB63488.1 DUF3013 family protein [Streptococcus sp. zg-86]MTB89863.1 DUF3013 family protein [Streptococcus sp. zg-36]MWV55534.1 DUF3013 family protein [Streptococcus sp. zg-70]QTH47723.1 DUF3013 family protein [Streptococcus sp. zg-86]